MNNGSCPRLSSTIAPQSNGRLQRQKIHQPVDDLSSREKEMLCNWAAAFNTNNCRQPVA